MTDWPVKTLGEVVRFDSETARPEDLSSTDVYVGLENIAGDGTLVGLGGVSAETLKSNKSRFTGDHILFGKLRPYLVKVVRPDFDGVCSTDILPLKPTGELTRDYLYWYMRSSAVIEAATEASTGTTLPRVSPTTLKSFEIPVPPLEEQKRIVALLDAATSSITELTSCYEQARTQANNLFTSALRDELEGNPDWPVKTLGEVCVLVNGATPDTKIKDYWGGPHAWITPAEMGGLDSPFLAESRRTLSDKGLASCSATLVEPKSVILSSRAPIGHLVINEVPMATNQGCKSLIPKIGLNFKFLFFYLKANVEFLNSLGTGTTFKELSGTQLKTVEIPVPPLEEQKRIVALLDAATASITELTACYDAKLTAAKDLRQSILESAFAGEL